MRGCLTILGIYLWCRGIGSGTVQTDSGVRIWHSLYTLPEVIGPTSGVDLSDTLGISTLSKEGV